jgi:adenylate cyclase
LSLCERALQLDRKNVSALVALAYKYIAPVIGAQSSDPAADIQHADELATQALAIDPGSYSAHLAKASVLISRNHHEEAIVEAERSLALNPSFTPAYVALTQASNYLGQPNRALEYADRAIRLSPRDYLS